MQANRFWARFGFLVSSLALAARGQTQGTCSGPDIEKGNWNISTVKGGGKAPTIDLGPDTYCVVFIATYHYNGGKGDTTPGTLTLTGGGRTLGPFTPLVEQTVNWVYRPPANAPLLLTGRVTVIDSNPGTWSNNDASDFILPGIPNSNGFGFAKFVLRAYTPPGGSSGGTSSPEACPALSWRTAVLPEGAMLSGYQTRVEPAGGVPRYKFSLDERATPLPRGILFDRDSGLLAGVPLERGDFTLRISVTDSCRQPQTSTRDFLVRIGGPSGIEIFGPDKVTFEPGKETSVSYVVSGGDAATRVLSVTAPAGIIARVEGNRTLIVTGSTPGIYRVTLRATDGVSPPGEKTVTVEVTPPPLGFRTASPLPAGNLYASYGPAQLEASGGCPPYGFSVVGPTPLNQTAQPLPSGLALSTSGTLSGVPLELASRTVKISVTDRCGGTVVRDFVISINPAPPLQISGAASIILEAGKTISEKYTITGGNPSKYGMAVTASPGIQATVTRTESTRNLGLTASMAGNQSVAMTITDGSSPAVEKKVDLRVAEAFSWELTPNPDHGRSCIGLPIGEFRITARNGAGEKSLAVSQGSFLGPPVIAVNGGPPESRQTVSLQAGPGITNVVTLSGIRAEGIAELTGDISGSLPADSLPNQACGGLLRGLGDHNRGNSFQARRASVNSLLWQGPPFDPPLSVARLRSAGVPLTQPRSFFRFSNVPEGVRMWVHAPPQVSRDGDGCMSESPLGGSAHVVSERCGNDFWVNQSEIERGRIAFQVIIDPIESVLRASIAITSGFQISQGQIIRSIEERRSRLFWPRTLNLAPDASRNSLAPVSPGSRAIFTFPPTEPPFPPGAGRSRKALEGAPYLEDSAGTRHSVDILRTSESGATVILIPEKAATGQAFLAVPNISVAQEIEIVDSAPSLYEAESADGTQPVALGSAAAEDASVSYASHPLSVDGAPIPVELSRLPAAARMLVTLDGTGFGRPAVSRLRVLVANRPVPLIAIEPNPDEPGKERITFALPARGIPEGKVPVELLDNESPLNPVVIEIR